MPVHRSAFRFDPAFRAPLALLGVRPETSWVLVDDEALEIRYGPWRQRTPRTNITGAQLDGPYRWWRTIGPHLSFADQGVTFGTSTAAGVCVQFADAVPALVPGPWPRHPGATVTVSDPEALRDVLGAPPG